MGRRPAGIRIGRSARGCPGGRCSGRALENLFPVHLQSGPGEDLGDDLGNAAKILEEFARGVVDPRDDRRGAAAGAGDGAECNQRAGAARCENRGTAGGDAGRRPADARRGAAIRAGVPPLRVVRSRQPGGVRRRAGQCAPDDCRRTAGRSGGSGGASLCRAGGRGAGCRARSRGARPVAGLDHQCGQALQVQAAGQTPPAPDAGH